MSQDLTTNSPPRTPITPELSPELTRLLISLPSADEAVSEISGDPVLFHEAQRALPALHDYAVGRAGEHGVKAVIGRRFALYPQPQRSDGEWAMWWADYHEVLADTPMCALEAAMAAYVKQSDSEFMPKPGKLLELAKMTPNRGAQAYTRAKLAVTGKPADLPRPEPTADEKAAVRKMAADFAKTFAERRPASLVPPMPSTAGKPDAGGLTPQMRELLAKQRGEG